MRNRPKLVIAVGTTRYAYTDFGALLSEDGPWDADTVTYGYTTNRLRASLTLAQPNASDWVNTYAYDNATRLTGVTSPAGTFSYLYDPSAHLQIARLLQPPGSYITNTFDSLGHWTGTYLKNSSHTLLNAHAYELDDAHRRTKQTRLGAPASGPAFTNSVDYTYDSIGQLKTATGKEADGATRQNERFGYNYDAAWNLNQRTNGALVQTFNCDSLNQLTTITRTNAHTVSGVTWGAATNVTVADNGNSAVAAARYTDNTFARTNVTLLNGTNTFTAIAQDSAGRTDTNTTISYLPSTNSYAYDGNGNMTTNGTRIFEYDDENQLTRITEPTAWKSEFTYDGKMRRRIRKEYLWQSAITNWVLAQEVHYIYDGKLPIQERHFNPQLSTQTPLNSVTYTRGRDLGGSLEGAGGIGGLLARTDSGRLAIGDPSAHAYYHADGNGNVTFLITTNQTLAARYVFDPYGNSLAAVGTLADGNLYRFSSKEDHPSSGLVYYLYRYYAPDPQRWLSRDPISEVAFVVLSGNSGAAKHENEPNLYVFIGNGPLSFFDAFGLKVTGVCSCQNVLCSLNCICVRFDLTLVSMSRQLTWFQCLVNYCATQGRPYPAPLIE